MIEMKNLCFSYPDKNDVINHIHFTINKNEKIAVVGKSGCGKTTFLFLLASILKPEQGTIKINGKPLLSMRRETGIIFQNGGLFPWKTVEENLLLGLKTAGLSSEETKRRIDEVLKELDIYEIRKKYLKHISGGQRQRVAIARVLVLNSDLLLLDEPSSALDAMTKDHFQNSLLKLYQKHDVTSVLVTHDIEEAVYLGEKIIIMKEGCISEVINNSLYGNENAKNTLPFYQKCIEIREKVN